MNDLCFSTNLTSSELAAWVQTWGSLLGLAVAIAVPATQHWLARRAAKLERLEVLLRNTTIVHGLMLNAIALLTDGKQQILALPENETRGGWSVLARHVSSIVSTMRLLPLDSLPGAHAVSILQLALHGLDDVVMKIELGGNVVQAIDFAQEKLSHAVDAYATGLGQLEQQVLKLE